jgi:hypothetical protein
MTYKEPKSETIRVELVELITQKLLQKLVEVGTDFGDNFFVVKDFTKNNCKIFELIAENNGETHITFKSLTQTTDKDSTVFSYHTVGEFILENQHTFVDALEIEHNEMDAIIYNTFDLEEIIALSEKIIELIETYNNFLRKHQKIIDYSKKMVSGFKKILLIEKIKRATEEMDINNNVFSRHNLGYTYYGRHQSTIIDVNFEKNYLEQLNSDAKAKKQEVY